MQCNFFKSYTICFNFRVFSAKVSKSGYNRVLPPCVFPVSRYLKRNVSCQSKTTCFGVKGGILSNCLHSLYDTKTTCFGFIRGTWAQKKPIYQIVSRLWRNSVGSVTLKITYTTLNSLIFMYLQQIVMLFKINTIFFHACFKDCEQR